MNDRIGIDWEGFAKHRHNPDALKALAKNITEYFQELGQKMVQGENLAEVIKQLTGKAFPSDANLTGAVPIVSVYGNTEEPDFGFERIFAFIDMRKSKSKTFEILDATNGITFEQVKEGEPAKLRAVTTAKASVGFLKFFGGLGFLDDWWRFNQYYLMDQVLREVRAKYYDKKSQIHYDIITGLTGIDEAFDTDDVTTINNACANIIAAVKGKGYGVGDNPTFKITCGSGLKARIAKALAAGFYVPNSNNNQIVYKIDEVIATGYLPNTHYHVCLPGIKSQRGVWDDLNGESQRNALRRAEDMTWEGKYNAAVGDKTQFKKCALSV